MLGLLRWGVTLLSFGGLAYDWLKSSTKEPEIVIESANVKKTDSTDNWSQLLQIATAGLVAYIALKN